MRRRERPADGVHWRPPPGGVRRPVWAFGLHLLGATAPRALGYRVEGRRHIPDTGGVLVLANHPADLDPPAVGLACGPRPAQYMALAKHFTRLPLATLLFALGAFPVRTDRPDLRAMRYAREQLALGRLVIVFPEGGASWSPVLGPFREGAGHLALTPGVTVVPAAVWGTQAVLRGWRPVGRGPVRVSFGPPLGVPAEGTPRERAAAVTADARAAIEALLAPLVRAAP
ncbi:MAG: lysophospholipid acyltransferase family protein [Thermoleophilia bacterium]